MDGATECSKCTPSEYQSLPGQTHCNKCKLNEFSRIGAVKCSMSPNCTVKDYSFLPQPVSQCTKSNDGNWTNEVIAYIPQWPGKTL